jgi:hypothetical protein
MNTITDQLNQVHALTPCFLNIRFNIITHNIPISTLVLKVRPYKYFSHTVLPRVLCASAQALLLQQTAIVTY